MPVDSKNYAYLARIGLWQKCREVADGATSVKANAPIYLPRMESQDEGDYEQYVRRAYFFNATGRTIDSFNGLVFFKDPSEDYPDSLDEIATDISLQGESIYDYEKFLLNEVLTVGRSGSLIDWSAEEARPYVINYQAEQIINWQAKRINGKLLTSLVVLKELVSMDDSNTAETPEETTDLTANNAAPIPRPFTVARMNAVAASDVFNGGSQTQTSLAEADNFNPRLINQIRVLSLETGNDGKPVYTVTIYQPKQTKKNRIGTGATKTATYVETFKTTPLRKGQPINEIPFVFHGVNNLLPTPDKPPMADIVDANIHHFINSADYEHALHYTALPTPYICANKATKSKISLGSKTIIQIDDASAKIGYLEFNGEGLKSLETAIANKEQNMASLGARMLETPKRVAETVDTLNFRQTGEQASLSQIAITTSRGIEKVLQWFLWWMSPADTTMIEIASQETVTIELNTQFNPTSINPQLLAGLVAARQAGLMSQESFTYALKRGDVIDPTLSVEDEIEKIENEMTTQGEPLDLKEKPPAKQPPTVNPPLSN